MKNTGQLLKSKREEKKLSVESVHGKTFIPLKFIRALEEGNVSVFPAEVYFIGSLRRYAAFLGLDPEEMMQRYREEIGQAAPAAPEKEEPKAKPFTAKPFAARPEAKPAAPKPRAPEKKDAGKNTGLFVIGTIVVVIILIAALVGTLSKRQGLNRENAAAPAASTTTAPAEIPIPANALRLEITALQPTFVRVTADGTPLYQGTLIEGEKRLWPAKNQFTLMVNNAPGVSVTLNGKPIDMTRGAVRDVNEVTLGWNDAK